MAHPFALALCWRKAFRKVPGWKGTLRSMQSLLLLLKRVSYKSDNSTLSEQARSEATMQ